MAGQDQVKKAKEEAKKLLSELPGIRGIGITWDEDKSTIIKINIASDISPEVLEQIPEYLNGIKVKTFRVGKIIAQ